MRRGIPLVFVLLLGFGLYGVLQDPNIYRILAYVIGLVLLGYLSYKKIQHERSEP